MGVLWDNLQRQQRAGGGGSDKLVDVQIITSAGMAIQRGPNPIVPGGVVYLSDGGALSAACIRTDTDDFDPNQVCEPSDPMVANMLVHMVVLVLVQTTIPNLLPCRLVATPIDASTWKGTWKVHQKQGCASTLKKYGIHVMSRYE
jgi:hypothetical protein